MKPRIQPSKILILVTIFLSISLVTFWFLTLPILRAIGTDMATVQDTVNHTAASVAKGSATTQTSDAALRSQVLTLLPTSDQQYDLPVQVEALCKTVGVNITALSVNAVTATGLPQTSGTATAGTTASGASKVSIQLTATGQYAAGERLVTSLTGLNRFLQIDQLTVTGDAKGNATVSLTASAYYLPASQ